jgi:hypothetical protein
MDKVWLCPVSEKARLAASPDFDHRFAENLFSATPAYEHLHEFPCFVSSNFTSSLVVFLMSLKHGCWPLVGDTSDT